MKFIALAFNLAVLLQPSTAQVFSKGGKGKGYTAPPSPSPTKSPTKSPTASPTISAAPTSCQDNPGRFLVPGTGGDDMRLCDWVNRRPGTTTWPWRCDAYPEAAANCRVSCGLCPTESPSFAPSFAPSAAPSGTPTSRPSTTPSGTPTSRPSTTPTSRPSTTPSGTPTSRPSTTPTSRPSTTPSGTPTSRPSTTPSGTPTSRPSTTPSKTPTISPSVSPSVSPTPGPTCPRVPPGKGKGKGKGAVVICTEPSPTPSASPTVSPTTAAPTVCADTTNRFPVNGVTQLCAWVIRGGGLTIPGSTPWRCRDFPEATEACKQTCGVCGCSDTTARFIVSEEGLPGTGVEQSCAWVARLDTANRCALFNIKYHCPETCGLCLP